MSSPRRILGVLIAATLAILCLSAPATAKTTSNDFPRLPRYCATPKELIPQKPVQCNLTKFNANRPTVVLWGDSHAWMMIPALKAAVGKKNVNLVAFVMGTCPPMDPKLTPRTRASAPSCDLNNDMALKFIRKLKAGNERLEVVLNGSWERYRRAFRNNNTKTFAGVIAKQLAVQTPRVMREFGKRRISTSVIGPIATVPTRKAKCKVSTVPYGCDLPRKKALQDEAGTRAGLIKLIAPLKGNQEPIDVNPVMCDEMICNAKISGKFTFYDDLHISASTSRKMKSYFTPIVNSALGR